MNKNLKKVISAVAALAMSASSFVALAANYPDVDASASYKQAVDELSALEVIEGYEDGTFQPDKLVTRAEFSKMVITALGSAELAQAEAAAGRDTQFKDVTGSHWAAGFVTAAVAQSIINGMGDGTFAPDANVTYAQAMKMLVCAAGYEQWSMDKGGWPDGYMYWGNQLKIGNGVKDVTDATEITRAQVAQMIDNILNAPVCVDTHEYAYDAYGNRYAKLNQMNGTGKNFESILTRNHDTYKVKGMVTDTNRSNSGATKVDEVKFEIQNATRWLDESKAVTKSNPYQITAKVGDTNVADYLKQYVEVMVREDDDEEYTILAVATAGQTDEKTEAADDYDADRTDAGTVNANGEKRMYFYSEGRSKSYKINESTTELYVNGVKIDDLNEGINAYVKDNKASDVTLVDVPDSGSTDGVYDLIYVNYYDTAIVDGVSKIDTDKPEIAFMAYSSETGATSKVEFDLSDRNKSYSIKDAEGNDVELADLAEYDVVSIQRDVTQKFKDSDFYDITVSKATEEGKYTTYDDEEKEYDINGTTYSVVSDQMVDALEPSVTYTLYLDAFGRIAYIEELAANKNIAVLDSVYSVRGSDYEVSLILKDGTEKAYILRNTDVTVDENTKVANHDLASQIVYGANFADRDVENKKPVEERVIEYTLNNSEELTIKSALEGDDVNGTFKASLSRLDGSKVSEDVTSLLNASEADDITSMSFSALVDDREYEAVLFDRASDGTYRFALIMSGSGSYSPDTQLAVFQKRISTQNESDDSVDAFVMFVDGESKTYFLEDGFNADLTAGDVVVFETNNSNEISDVTAVSTIDFTSKPSANYNTLRAAALGKDGSTEGFIATKTINGNDVTLAELLSSDDQDVEIAFGPVVDKSTNSITLATAREGKSVVKEDKIYSFDSDVKIYIYDSENQKASEAISVGTASDIIANKVTNSMYADDKSRKTYQWFYGEEGDETEVNPSFAIVRTVDKYVQEVYVILAND